MLKWPEPKAETESREEFYSRIHAWALSIFEYQMDSVVWGQPDHWETRYELEQIYERNRRVLGDCDSFCQLVRHAISPIQTRIVLCTVETGDYHAVCETPEGFVLDVRRPQVAIWPDLIGFGYKKDIMGPLCDPQTVNPEADQWYEAT